MWRRSGASTLTRPLRIQNTSEQRVTTLVHVLMATSTLMALYGLSQSVTYGVAFRVRGTMDSKMTFAGLLMLVDFMTLAQPPAQGVRSACHRNRGRVGVRNLSVP